MTPESIRPPVVAIDGPAGAGKSTVARRLAERLGYMLIDTGALYRAVALAARERGVAWDDADGAAHVARDLVARDALSLDRDGAGATRVVLEGRDVSLAIRAPEMSLGASAVSSIAAVRDALLALQRRAGEGGGVVMEGRDIGTVVFPDAGAKFFLTASVEVRAARRHAELAARGLGVTLEQTRAEVVARDRADSERAVAPLRVADDAEVVDTSGLAVDEVVERLAARVLAVARRSS